MVTLLTTQHNERKQDPAYDEASDRHSRRNFFDFNFWKK